MAQPREQKPWTGDPAHVRPAVCATGALAAAFVDKGRRVALADGQTLTLGPDVVCRVREGCLGSFSAPDHLCLAWHDQGALISCIGPLGDGPGSTVQALGPAVVQQIERHSLDAALGELETERWLRRASEQALRAAQEEGACIGGHRLDRRTAKWILRLSDPRSKSLGITQERLSQILGVQRTTINGAMQALKKEGLLRCLRGKVIIFDREGLRETACACRSYKPVQPSDAGSAST